MRAEQLIAEMERRMKMRVVAGMTNDAYLAAAVRVLFEVGADAIADLQKKHER